MNYLQLAANIDQVLFSSDKNVDKCEASLKLKSGLSTLELSDLVESLTIFFGEEKVVAQNKNVLSLSGLDEHLVLHLRRFGGHNLVLARFRKRDDQTVQFQPKPEVTYDSVRKYFSKSYRPKVGPECSAKALAELSERKGKFMNNLDIGGDYVIYDNRFGAAASGARKLPNPELAQYLQRRQIEELVELTKKSARNENRQLFQAWARLVLNLSVETILPGKKGTLTVDLTTEVNCYPTINILEHYFSNRSDRFSFNYNL